MCSNVYIANKIHALSPQFKISQLSPKILGAWAKSAPKLVIWMCLSVRLSVFSHVSARLQTDAFLWNLALGTSMILCSENSNMVKIRQKYFTWRLIMFYCCYRRHSVARKALSWTEILWGSWDSRRGINITRSLHNVTLYVHCLFFFSCSSFVLIRSLKFLWQ